ncbi:MAG: hypothetical protein KatS3mg109_0816 [Pirellulaceae bacterium]|nr:MAG: hypothetical protein KatS3mg109_0816 [Pirellulaceae bacterium]
MIEGRIWLVTRLLAAGLLIGGLVARADEVPLKPAANGYVAIPREALGKEYLLVASLIPQSAAPTSTGLASRVVTFELYADGVDMYEATAGSVVTTDLPARRLLATFPIVSQDEKAIIIDFNSGMNRVIAETWIYDGRDQWNPESLSQALEIPRSRVFSVEESEGRLTIRQAAQVRNRQDNANLEARYEIRYFIEPYRPCDMPIKENYDRDVRYVRFFSAHPQVELTTGRTSARIARFDIREPIVFCYSANTPEEYVQAVKDGILYWNRAFGKEVIRVEKAPEGVTAPHPQYNVVQWVPWDRAGFAYADILIDPRTGRSIRGQAYITSVFAFSGKQRARALLRTLHEQMDQPKKSQPSGESPSGLLGIPFLQPVCSCQWDAYAFARDMTVSLEAALADPQVTDAKILEASQDYVRNVVAHEVGHVLGLRHNFAGSLAATLTPAELDEWFKAYLTQESPPDTKGKWTTNSVMEYSIFQAAVFNGYKIRTTDEVFPHDKAAIQWGYFDSNEVKEQKMLFATDEAAARYGDVRTFDYGTDPVTANLAAIERELRTLPNTLIETFIAAKAPEDPRDAIPVAEVNLSFNRRLRTLGERYTDMLAWFSADTRSLRMERDFPYVGPLNEEEVRKVRWERLNEEIKKLGGIDRTVFAFIPVNLTLDLKNPPQGVPALEKFDANKMANRVAELLDSPAYSTFVGADGKTHSFTDEEKAIIKERAKLFFREMEKELLKAACRALASAKRDLGVQVQGTPSDDDIVAQLEKQIINLARTIILTKDETKTRQGKLNKSTVLVPEFRYDEETRLAAAQMLSDTAGSYRSWSRDERGAIHTALRNELDAALNLSNLKSFNEANLSRPLRDWYLEQQRILQLLPPAAPSSSSSQTTGGGTSHDASSEAQEPSGG